MEGESPMSEIRVEIRPILSNDIISDIANVSSNEWAISVWNDGPSIPIAKHSIEQIYVPGI